MAENQRKRKLSATNSQTRQVLRLNSPSFEEEFNALMLASDQSDSEGDCDDFLISENDFLQNHDSDQDEYSQESRTIREDSNEEGQITCEEVSSDSSEDEDIPLSELRI
ncbi:uncharacterized protein LOC123693898 [Colias croceus]|uniref:uncharacterized protein LOC123693898 n=1 Tax=Colias crocea TaxID=72248 RepID=UPI001E2812EF|nr:uncharacterized protein LOC123693898 [Colias croceus]